MRCKFIRLAIQHVLNSMADNQLIGWKSNSMRMVLHMLKPKEEKNY